MRSQTAGSAASRRGAVRTSIIEPGPFSLFPTQLAFTDPRRVVAEDFSHSSREKRYYCFGEVGGGVLTVRFTYREGVIRIIGAGYWRKGKRIYDRENQVHRRTPGKT